MAKQQTEQRFILKVHTGRLRKARWNLTLPLAEARRNDEVVSLGDSQILRFIDELNGMADADAVAKVVKKEIKNLKKEPNSLKNRRKIRKLYEKLDEILYKPDFMNLVIDSTADYRRAVKGFSINGIRYVRLLGTNGGVKSSTIVFVSERLAPELRRRIDNGRDETKELVPAKLEAYQALVCSGSTPVRMPKGVAVVDDCVTKFFSDVIALNDENDGEPVMEYIKGAEVELDESDGYGMMLPSLAEKWSEDLGLSYTACGMNTRFAWEKGMVFAFDFLEFADKVAGTRIIKDAWGNEVDLGEVELVLTTSMVKLWDSYPSCEAYLRNCRENGYTFSVPKTCPEELENERNLNYQFIQPYDLTDDQIEELIGSTVQELHDVLRLDWRKTVLFLKGKGLTIDNIDRTEPDFCKAMMVEPGLLKDPFVTRKVLELVRKRIKSAKIGVLKVHGNFSIISGDPYSLCQNMFGLPVTGILKAGEIYNKYWLDCGAERVVCFRAPMSCHNNIRRMQVNGTEEARHWYQYMTTCTVLNSWDTTAQALNGCDKDGDLIFITDNRVLLENARDLPAIMCAQRRAKKCVPTEGDMVQANINSFGDDIGKITNHITSMFDVMSQFPEDSEEYRVLDYRIKCGQLFQQNAIDKAKGIVAKPMPKHWYARAANHKGDFPDERERAFNLRILAEKKPYFMQYIYPDLRRQYRKYIENTNKKCLREFRLSIEELLEKDPSTLTGQERNFLFWYKEKMPVSTCNGVMNRICRRLEEEFDGYVKKYKGEDGSFDYTILKSGEPYSAEQYRTVGKLLEGYRKRLREYTKLSKKERVDDKETIDQRWLMIQELRSDCYKVCSNSAQLCDIMVDLCYQREGTKQLLWDVVGEEVIRNLLRRHNGRISFPTRDEDGDLFFGGERFSVITWQISGGDEDDHYTEREGVCGAGVGDL